MFSLRKDRSENMDTKQQICELFFKKPSKGGDSSLMQFQLHFNSVNEIAKVARDMRQQTNNKSVEWNRKNREKTSRLFYWDICRRSIKCVKAKPSFMFFVTCERERVWFALPLSLSVLSFKKIASSLISFIVGFCRFVVDNSITSKVC